MVLCKEPRAQPRIGGSSVATLGSNIQEAAKQIIYMEEEEEKKKICAQQNFSYWAK